MAASMNPRIGSWALTNHETSQSSSPFAPSHSSRPPSYKAVELERPPSYTTRYLQSGLEPPGAAHIAPKLSTTSLRQEVPDMEAQTTHSDCATTTYQPVTSQSQPATPRSNNLNEDHIARLQRYAGYIIMPWALTAFAHLIACFAISNIDKPHQTKDQQRWDSTSPLFWPIALAGLLVAVMFAIAARHRRPFRSWFSPLVWSVFVFPLLTILPLILHVVDARADTATENPGSVSSATSVRDFATEKESGDGSCCVM
ncbi:hypothetical protein LTR05_007444 [Lithohypha guttulata]|uniref:Uncharacterized protein n=1 Tax=Lithohypha guttulata TaxID=1690604 RepID=A0AAN7Y4D9_9EURO|nr:hypothetical protein LTR05_007444 [Lithohypha guttulata]